jgi:dUTP pyrophosphatase
VKAVAFPALKRRSSAERHERGLLFADAHAFFHRRAFVTSLSQPALRIKVFFFRDAGEIYGERGLVPATPGSAGLDLRACPEGIEEMEILPGERCSIPAGLAVEPLEEGMAGFVYSRSGLGAVKGITVAQGVGLIDPDYRGEIGVFLLNTGRSAYTVRKGERIAQLVFQPFVRPVLLPAENLGGTERGAGGFGHTGLADFRTET